MMKKIIYLSVALAIVLLSMAVAGGCSTAGVQLEDDQIKDADHIEDIKAALGEIVNVKPGDLTLSPMSEGNIYIFFTADKTAMYTYDAEFAYVSGIGFNEATIPSENMIDLDTAKATTLSFLQQYYPMEHFAGMKLIHGELSDHGSYKTYNFLWQQEINGILGPNLVSVGVDPYNGKVFRYSSKRADVTISNFTPGISEEEVVALAESILTLDPSHTITHSEARLGIWLHPDTGKDYLRWTVSIETEFEDETVGGYVFEFDAVTGELVRH